jgi:hypothetical protein
MNKDNLIQEMTVKAQDVTNASIAVTTYQEEIKQILSEDKATVSDLEQELKNLKDNFSSYTDKAEAKVAWGEIKALEEEIELTRAVNAGKDKVLFAELEIKSEKFFALHKIAVTLFDTVDNYFLANTTLSELSQAEKLLDGFACKLDFDFSDVQRTMLDAGIVKVTEQNLVWRGTHLGQQRRYTQLAYFLRDARNTIDTLKKRHSSNITD